MEDTELEEGEACDDPDSACDPDTAFSYLDEKLVLVLGDVQKEFEGGVPLEKLGSKFGGYGSFLPAYKSTPSILLQQKASVLAANETQRTKISPVEGIVERMKRAAAVLTVGVNNDKAFAGHDDGGRAPGLINEKMNIADSALPASRSDESAALKKKVTLRIKMGSDANVRKKNTEIYSDFGLTYSSSPSLEDDEDDQKSDSDLESSPDRTPLTMIRIMMSHHLPHGILLSPLPDLISEPFVSKEKLRLVNQEGLRTKLPVSGKPDSIYDPDLVKVEEEGEKVDNYKEDLRRNFSEGKNDSDTGFDYGRKVKKEDIDKKVFKESSKNIPKSIPKAMGKDSSKLSEFAVERQDRDAVSESGTGGRLIEPSRESKRSFRDKSLTECTTEEVEHIPKHLGSPFEPLKEVESSREGLSRANKGDKETAVFHDSLKDQFDGLQDIREHGKEMPTFEDELHGKKQHEANGELMEGKKWSGSKQGDLSHEERRRGSKDASKSTSKNKGTGRFVEPDFSATYKEHGKETLESKKKFKETGKEGHVSRGPLKGGNDSLKDARKGSVKDTHVKEVSSKDKINESLKEGHRDLSKTAAKDSQKDLARQLKKEINEPRKKEKLKEGLGAELSGKDSSRFIDRDRQKDLVVSRDVPMKATDSTLTNPQYTEASGCNQTLGPEVFPVDNGVPPPAVPAPNVMLITENWVCCDRCEKWRLLPPRVGTEKLPKKWRCKMLDWLPGMNNCSVTEEVTTHATQELHYLVAAPPPVQAGPLAEPAQPCASVIMPVVPSNADLDDPSQEMGLADRTRVTVGKKRKVPSVGANEPPPPTKSKFLTDSAQISQEGTQGRLGSEDSGHVPAAGEKRRVKEREKPKRSRMNDGTSPLGKEHGETLASKAMREAKDLKHHADRLKGKDGMERESTALYLRAALKFLHAAAMYEPAQADSGENGDNALSLAVYTDTAKLCEFCAVTFERSKEMAAAALAYKCAGLARMRVVQAKSLSMSRDRAELQSAHQQVPPGESPCSSIASDVDNLNDRLAAKSAASPSLTVQTGGNLILPARCRSSYNRMLQFVGDTNAAMEALSKSNNACIGIEASSIQSSFGVEGMAAVKRVVDFGFHDVESFLRLVRLAMEAIGH